MLTRKFLKRIASLFPIPLTTNELYDRLTFKVIKQVCRQDTVCIDVGANEGKILQMFISTCGEKLHYAFEPIPALYHQLKRKYGSAANIYNLAVGNTSGTSKFNYVITDPAYSGLKKRSYDRIEKEESIEVQVCTLDEIIPHNIPIRLIKLDIEGGEYDALQGAKAILVDSRPYLLFEFGKAGAEAYGVTPQMMFNYLDFFAYRINTLSRFLQKKAPLTLSVFSKFFQTGSEYFFIAFTTYDE